MSPFPYEFSHGRIRRIEKATHVQSAPNGDISLVFEQPGRNASTSTPLDNIIREVAMALRQAQGEAQ